MFYSSGTKPPLLASEVEMRKSIYRKKNTIDEKIIDENSFEITSTVAIDEKTKKK